MLEMLMKQILGDIDLTQVQQQFQNFAQAFAQLMRDVQTVKAQQAEILALLRPQEAMRLDAPQETNVTEQPGVDNGH